MKHPLLLAVIGLTLVSCSEKPPEKKPAPQVGSPAATPAAAPGTAAASGRVKAATVRPAVIQSTVNLPDSCAFDFVNDQSAKTASIPDKARVKMAGWAGNVAAGTSARQVVVELEGPSKAYIQATAGIKRPDVADHFKKPGLSDAGWVVDADLSELTAGSYKVRIIQVDGQSGLVCDSNVSMAIK